MTLLACLGNLAETETLATVGADRSTSWTRRSGKRCGAGFVMRIDGVQFVHDRVPGGCLFAHPAASSNANAPPHRRLLLAG